MQRESLAPRPWCLQLAIAALFLVGSLGLNARPARADIDLRFDIGHAPRFTGFYYDRPHRWYDSSSGVYVIDDPRLGDYDAFQYGGYYWVFRDGYWYRSTAWDRGFVAVNPQYVPSVIYDVPSTRWHHHPSWQSMRFSSGWHNRDWDRRYWRTRDRDWRDRNMRNTYYRRHYDRRDRGDSYYRYRDQNDRSYRNQNDRSYDQNDRYRRGDNDQDNR